MWKQPAAFPSPVKPLGIILPYKETKASETFILVGSLQLAPGTCSLPRVSILPPPKHLSFTGPLPKISPPLASSSLCFFKPPMLIYNTARLKLRGLALQKERVCKAKHLYVSSPGSENNSIWLRSVAWLLCLCDSALPREE